MRNAVSTPDLLSQNLPFNNFPRGYMCTSKSEKHWFGDSGSYLILKKNFFKYLFIWLHWILVTTFRILHCGTPRGASGKEPACQCRRHKRHEFNLWVRKIPGGGHGNPLQYSCLENPMARGAWLAMGHRVAESRTWLKWLSTHTCITESLCCTAEIGTKL